MREHQKCEKEYNLQYNSVYSLLYNKFLKTPHRTFLIALENDKEEFLTYKQFLQKVSLATIFLKNKKLNRGDSINLLIDNSLDFLVVYFAALSLGIIVVPINYNFMSKEIEYVAHDSKSRMIFTDYRYIERVEKVKENLKNIEIVIFSDEEKSNYENISKFYENSEKVIIEKYDDNVSLDDKGVIIYTSGTKGNPKGAILTHRNMLSDGRAIAEWFNFDKDTRTLCLLPLFHNNGQIVTLLAPLWAGGSTIMRRGSVGFIAFWELANQYKATWSSVIPTMLSMLLNFKMERIDDSMEGIICGGALLPKKVHLDFEKTFNVPVFEGFGLTETTSFASFNPRELDKRKIGSIGMPLPVNEMCIRDEDGNFLGADEVGEICIRGYNLFLEYCQLPERNKKVFRDGWFHSGDYGYYDEDGFYYFKNRMDDLIIKGGENIYPREIENVVYGISGVKSCAAIGVEHDMWGEDIVLFVECEDNVSLDENEILDFCHNRIADYKIPSKVYFIKDLEDMDTIPKGATNKILRKSIKKYYDEYLR